MEILMLFMLAIGLSFDTFAVSLTCGCIEQKILFRQAVRIAFFFAFFQAFMPVLGWLLGSSVKQYVEAFDHWIAFGLLSILGIKMIIESIRGEEGEKVDIFNLKVILSMSVATTIDAFIVGIVFASLSTNLFLAIPIIGSVTFVVAMLGMLFGKNAGKLLGKKMEIVGGLILIAIGVKVLVEHLM